MTISERIFERLSQLSMTQKGFSEKTGILPSTISEWKKNKTNPSSEKIMPICEAAYEFAPDYDAEAIYQKLHEEKEEAVTA